MSADDHTELSEELEVALIDLADGESIEATRHEALLSALGGPKGLERALEELRFGTSLAQNISSHLHSVTPPEGFVDGVLSQTRRRRRLPPSPKASLWFELWPITLSLALLLSAWLTLNHLQKTQEKILEQRLTPLEAHAQP